MSHVNIEQSRVGRKKHPIPNIDIRQIDRRQAVFQNRPEKCLLTNLDIRGVAEADNWLPREVVCFAPPACVKAGIFQRLMEQLFHGIPMKAVYLDVIVCTDRTEESPANLISVLERLQTAGLRLKLDATSLHLRGSSPRCRRNSSYPWEGRVIADAPVPRDQCEVNGMLLPQVPSQSQR